MIVDVATDPALTSSFELQASSFLLAVSFITPGLAIGGLLLAAVPIIIHLLNRRRFKTVEFAAMRFVLEAMRRNRRRLQFESWLLLAMRCLLISCIGIGLARPLGCDNAFAGVAGRDRTLHLVVLDNSGSTQAITGETTVVDQLRSVAVAVLEQAERTDARVAAFAASAPASDLVPEPTFDLAAAADVLMSLPTTSLETDLAGAVARAIDAAEFAEPGERIVLHVLSDLAADAVADPRLESASSVVSERFDEVRLYRPTGNTPVNTAVLAVGPEERLVRRGFDVPIVATLAGTGSTDVAWSVSGNTIDRRPIAIAPEGTEVAAESQVADALEDGIARVVSLSLVNADDALAADDERFAVVERVAALPTLVVEGTSAADGPGETRSLLSVALSPGGAGYVDVRQITGLELPDTRLDAYEAVVLSDVGGIDDASAGRLATFVEGGGTRHEALEKSKTSKSSIPDNNKQQLAVLHELSSWCLKDLGTSMNRRKVETLVTIQVHQRDVFADLARLYKERKTPVDPNDFDWLKQARFYWRPNSSDDHGNGCCLVSICDVDFHYAFEYLGCKERLVVTPLTDRCYITLSQALGMHLGGAPAGPAGTGKTEVRRFDDRRVTRCCRLSRISGEPWGCSWLSPTAQLSKGSRTWPRSSKACAKVEFGAASTSSIASSCRCSASLRSRSWRSRTPRESARAPLRSRETRT
ncbi:MAG: BatA domain-containing protein [Planctomycetota bacterium]